MLLHRGESSAADSVDSKHCYIKQVAGLKLDLLQALVVVISYSRRMHLPHLHHSNIPALAMPATLRHQRLVFHGPGMIGEGTAKRTTRMTLRPCRSG